MNIAIYNNGIAFDGGTPFARPLGGSESGVVYMARELVRLGHTVTVYCNCPRQGAFDNVLYAHYHRFFDHYKRAPWDLVIAFRSFDPILIGRVAPKMIFWCGDDVDQPALANFGHPIIQDNVDLVFCVSEWHRRTFIERFELPPEKVIATRNGFNPELVPADVPKRWASGAYTSTPFRGLEILLRDVFPAIRARVPAMTLDVFSGMGVYGWAANTDRQQYGHLYRLAEQPGVTLHGSIAQPQLLRNMAEIGFLLYPNIFEETSCIAAIEAQASGAVVVTSAKAGLKETVEHGRTGICLQGDPHSAAYQREFVEVVCGFLDNRERLLEFSANARERAFRIYTWGAVAAEWNAMFEELEPRPVAARYSGPLSLLEKAHFYLENRNLAAASRTLGVLEAMPFLREQTAKLKQYATALER